LNGHLDYQNEAAPLVRAYMMRRRLYEELGLTTDLKTVPAIMAEIYCMISLEIQAHYEAERKKHKEKS
jgi:hypothetical protein